MPLRSGKLLKNRYTILAALAPGGFSRVYHARDETRAHEVAIKELDFADDRAAKRFFGEFQTMMLLRHPNIVEVHEIIEDEGGYYMVMEYMAGGSLADALDRGEKFSIERAIEIVGTVGRALAYAHAHRVVHCDIKPANILFTADGAAKLADFGIAHISELLKAFAWTMTPHSFIAGTVQYMPPEQVDGVRDDPRIDVYSLGA
ncbi:MAG: serine/threonine protein kinase, partial [Chloroflexi bacterium]|nr:serine/threonine protein kinase [Chloroflexota bacterium]